MGLINSPLCGRYGAEEETSGYVLCECGVLALLRHTYLGSFFLVPEDVTSPSLGAKIKVKVKFRCGALFSTEALAAYCTLDPK
jgi:hypothetical protein